METLSQNEIQDNEIWEDVKDFEGYYWISNLANIRSKYKIIKQHAKWTGHMEVRLSKGGVVTKYQVHRLVAMAFVEGRTDERNVVDHIDRNSKNNLPSNLRWVTQRENCWNKKDKSNKTSFKHVTKRGENRYTVSITRTFGSYKTAEEAHKAALEYLEKEDVIYQKYKHLKQ